MKRSLFLLAIGLLTLGASAQWSNPADEMPAYHVAAPAQGSKLPAILTAEQLKANGATIPWQAKAYADAAKVPNVIYQMPCFCRCDKALGHTSLHSCFEGMHGAECSTCAKEGVYAYEMTKQGKTVKQIREGILHKEYESVDLNGLS